MSRVFPLTLIFITAHCILNKLNAAEIEPRFLFLIFTALHLATEQHARRLKVEKHFLVSRESQILVLVLVLVLRHTKGKKISTDFRTV